MMSESQNKYTKEDWLGQLEGDKQRCCGGVKFLRERESAEFKEQRQGLKKLEVRMVC